MNNADLAASQPDTFLDHRAVDWPEVRRVRCEFYQNFRYEYPGPIYNLKQRLVILPVDRYGSQRLLEHRLSFQPSPLHLRETADPFGNRVIELEVAQADRLVSFEMRMSVGHDGQNARLLPVTMREMRHFSLHTKLTQPDARITDAARRLKAESSGAHDLAQRIHDWVYRTMRYKSGVTTVETTAAQALALGEGMCQDYAHLMLSVARTAALPARYVSGHLLGEGGSHAWVEVLLPGENGVQAVAFDPTNDRRPHLGYVTVAVGRDYKDVSPTSGSFIAPYSGQLTCSKRAALTMVEYRSGERLESAPLQ